MNREQWLTNAVGALNTHVFLPKGVEATNYKVSVGFASRGVGGQRQAVGECFPPERSAANVTEIFISPVLALTVGSANDQTAGVLDVLAHELIHCIVGNECGHKGPFKRLALDIGLVGKMKATKAGPVLAEILEKIAGELGQYPHAELDASKTPKKGSRLIKVVCPLCDNVARQARTPFVTHGLICGSCEIPMVESH